MITIEVKPSKNIKRCKNSAYVKFIYEPNIVSIIKSFPNRFYDGASQVWEVHSKYFIPLLESLSDYDVEIIGELPKDLEKELDELDRIDEQTILEYDFKTKPFDHQLEAFQYGQTHHKFLLADEQGLGKTKQSIDLAVARKHQFKHCLIVCCVNGLKWNWQAEVNIHSNEQAHILGEYTNKKGKKVVGSLGKRLEDLEKGRDEFFLITNIETLRDKSIQEKLYTMCKSGEIGMVIIDEIHKCKNSTSLQGKSIHKLVSHYRVALTGTPIMNTPLDLYNILKWIGAEHHSLTQFKQYYCTLGGFGGYEVVGYKHLDELQSCLDRVMLRRLKEDVLNLPPKIHSIEYVDMSKEQARLYEDIKASIEQNIDKVMLSPNPLVELIRLRQCTGYPGILSSTIMDSSKINRMLELVEESVANGRKVIVFSNWTSIIEPAFEALKQYNPAIITGKTVDRGKQERRFQQDDSCKVIVGTISAMGTGLTLTAGSTVIFLDSPWNRANKDQAEDRAHRIGTKSTVNVITLVAKDTIDERIESLIETKGKVSDAIVDNHVTGKIDLDTMSFLLS